MADNQAATTFARRSRSAFFAITCLSAGGALLLGIANAGDTDGLSFLYGIAIAAGAFLSYVPIAALLWVVELLADAPQTGRGSGPHMTPAAARPGQTHMTSTAARSGQQIAAPRVPLPPKLEPDAATRPEGDMGLIVDAVAAGATTIAAVEHVTGMSADRARMATSDAITAGALHRSPDGTLRVG